MNTKICPKCGKELPEEAVFCPYCMTKLIDVEKGKPIKVKRKFPVLLVAIISAVIIVSLVIGMLVISPFSSSQNDTADYSAYLGVWSDKDTLEDSTNGQNVLEIISVKGNVIRFMFSKVSSTERVATISNVTCEIVDGIGRFTFDEDGWFNKGVGKIKLLDDEIYLETTVTDMDEGAMWDIGGTFYLYRMKNYTTDLKSAPILGKDFSKIRNSFGEEIADSERMHISTVYHYSNLDITVSDETNKITYVNVYYTSTLSKSILSYGEINGFSTYDDIYAELGEPEFNAISDNTVGYNLKDKKYITFRLDDNMNVDSFTYWVSE